jgi:fatty-acyl-CoA synthase
MLRWPTATLYEGVAAVARDRPTAPALVTDDAVLTYDDLRTPSRALAAGLSDLGISAGDTVAVWLGNRPEWVTTQLAAASLGATVVAVNTRYRRHELAYMLDDSGAAAVVLEDAFLGTDYLEMLAGIVPEIREGTPETFDPEGVAGLEAVVALGSTDGYPAVREFEAVRAADPERAPTPRTDHERPVVVFYTSGTTGDPKGCLHDSTSVLNHSYEVGEHFGLGADDVGLTLLPFCGVMGYNYVLSVLTHGATAVVQSHFEAERAARHVDDHEVTYLSGTAEMFTRLLDADAFSPAAAGSLERGAVFFANGYDEGTFERIESAVGFPIVQPYGLSEANSQVFVGDPDDPQAQRKRVGGPLVHPEAESARVVDPESGAPLPAGERGELQLRGYNVLQGYLGKPERTAEDIVDGWLRTGDLCERDERGYLYYHARVDDALRVRGFLVSPRDIEQAIEAHEGVEMAQVVGAPHPRHGEVPVAFVKAAGGVTDADVAAFLDDRIADYKRPAAVVVVDEFPRTEGPHGEKVQKAELRARVVDRFQE